MKCLSPSLRGKGQQRKRGKKSADKEMSDNNQKETKKKSEEETKRFDTILYLAIIARSTMYVQKEKNEKKV